MKYNNLEPIIGNWYKNQDSPEEIFEVVATDLEQNLVEIQYFHGEIGELELGTWKELPLKEVAEPQDCSGAYELPIEVLSSYREVIYPINRGNPIDSIDQI